MKAECRNEDRRRAPESNTNNGRHKAQESQSRFRIGIVLVPSALFRGHFVGANSPDRLIQPIPSPGKPNAGATRPFFASLALCSAIVKSRAFLGRILTTDGHGWTRMGQRLLIRAHPCLSVVEFPGLRLAARLIPAPQIKFRRTVSQSVAVMLGESNDAKIQLNPT